MFLTILAFSQSTCLTADPFCTGTTYNFPAGTGPGTGTSAETGPNYGCLSTQPNPAWYYLQVATSGVIEIYMYGSSGYDIDFICWGPYTSNTAPCTAQLTGSSTTSDPYSGASSYYPSLNTIDCSFDPQDEEWCYIPNAVVGQYYILMITNFSNIAQNIVFSQSGGTGATDCSIVAPPVTNNGPLCVGQTLQLTVSNPVAGATYAWTGPNGFSSTTMNPTISNVQLVNAGTYSLVITVGGTSSAAVTTTVVVNANPVISAVASPTAICNGSSTTLTASGGSTYIWNGGSTSDPYPVSPALSTTYSVTGTSAAGCTGTATVSVPVNPNPTVSASASPAAICSGGSSTLTASGASTYSWSNSAGGVSTTVSPTSTTTYTVTGTSAVGCTGTATVTVTVSPNLSVTASASPSSVCTGQSSSLTASGGSTYQWSSGSTANPVSVTPASTSTYTVTGTSAAGCSGTATVSVIVNSNATITASASPSTICSGQNSSLTASGASTYVWDSGSSTNPLSVSPASTTIYSVTGTTGAGCTGATTVSVTVNPNPTVTATAASSTICIGSSTYLTGAGADSYAWSTSETTNPITVSPTTTTTYSVTGTNVAGCSGTATVNVAINSILTLTAVPSPASLCDGQSSVISVSGGSSYIWDSGSTANPLNVTPAATTTYSVTGSDTWGCSGTTTVTVQVNPMPVVSFTGSPLTGCDPTTVNFIDLSIGNISIWEWDFGDGGVSGLQNPSHVYDAGNFTVTLTVTTDAGCESSLTLSNYISILSNPNASFIANPPVTTEDASSIQFMNQSNGASLYSWDFGDGAGVSSSENPSYTYEGSGDYLVTLWVENSAGCSDSTSLAVIVKPIFTFYMPNSFSPNTDDRNDVFRPYGIGWDTDSYSLRIYNRWGALVFFSTDINHGWDGNLPDGAEAFQDVYSVKVNIIGRDGTKHEYSQGLILLKQVLISTFL